MHKLTQEELWMSCYSKSGAVLVAKEQSKNGTIVVVVKTSNPDEKRSYDLVYNPSRRLTNEIMRFQNGKQLKQVSTQ